ncbi:MAG: histidine kinase N-terminal 7TM domain-containing protein [Anaerolineae bacterium]
MTLLFSPYELPSFCAAILLALIGVYSFRHRTVSGAIPFGLFAFGASWWALTSCLWLVAGDFSSKLLWDKAEYFGSVFTPVALLAFTLDYTGRGAWLTRRNLFLVSLLPAVIVVLAWTNEWHHLILTRIAYNATGPVAILDEDYGPAFWVLIAYSYLLLTATTAFLIQSILDASQLYRRQMATVLLAILIAWVANIVDTTNLAPIELAPAAFALTALLIIWSLFRFRLLDVAPIARTAVIDGMWDGMIVLDARDHIVDLNPATTRFLGIEAERAIGRLANEVLADRPELRQALADRPDMSVEVKLGDSASPLWLEYKVSPLYDGRRRLTGRLILLHDITARKQAELQLQGYALELEARNADLDAFAQTAAHDLKNPLTSIIGYAALLDMDLESLPPAEAKLYASSIHDTGRTMVTIVNELLLMSSIRRLEQVNSSPVDMGVVVREALHRLDRDIARAHASVMSPKTWPVVSSYAPWITEVWVNYLSNALKYGGEPPAIDLGFDATPAPGDSLIRFWVRDNGQGLSPEAQGRLFKEFSQIGEVHVGSHGLGLSIARRIVDKLGGKVGVESELGRGSTFWFALPHMDGKNDGAGPG